MSHYHFIKCCCFQLCNVFRSQNMEIDQCLLESLPLGQRQRLVRRMRCDQVRAYYERERALQKQQCQLYGNGTSNVINTAVTAASVGPVGNPKARGGGSVGHRKKMRVTFPVANMIQDAIIRHDDKEVLRMLKEGTDISTRLSSGGSLLHLCARHDSVFAAEVLLERGLNVNLQDEDLWTALHVACACDHSDMVLLLLLAGANVLLQDVSGNIPLDYATEGTESSYILLAHLEENGVDLSSLHLMRTQRSSTMLSDIRLLVNTGLSLNQHNDEGVTLLHMACASGYREVVSLLLESGADPQVADNSYWTPLHLASKYGQTRIVNQLLRYKADPTLLNCSLDKPSDVAASDQIADILLRAEDIWVQSRKDPGVLMPMPEENLGDLVQDVATPVKKLAPLAVPISKQDSLLEKGQMFREVPGALSRQPSQDNGLDGIYPSGTSKLEQVKLMPPAPNDDLASLSELTDSSLLYEMQKRFGNNQIYTYIGHILLLVNPNKDLPIYSNLVSQLYLSSTGRLCSSLPPHVFSSAERAYHMMLQERRPQCFIISGESGSGKTEASKHLLKHLAARSSPKGFALEPRMKHVNCVLEAFGHARSPMNTNSSRFIKLITLQYCEKRRTILRARLHTYLLEKWRVTCSSNQQSQWQVPCFSIFQLMAEGLSAEEKSSFYLNNMLTHRLLRGTLTVSEGASTGTASAQSRDKLASLKQALRSLGFNKLEVENIFVVLASLLHLGDLGFSELGDEDVSLPSDRQLLERVSCMLQVNPDDLSTALTSDVQFFKGDMVSKRHGVSMSNHSRNLMAKALYGRLFSHLVNHINCYLQGPDDAIGDPALEIGVLDIFGFEELQRNSFEQLCINMTSERIQQYVSEVLFQQEQQECLQEGISAETLRSPGNQSAVLDFFFQKPQGMLSLLDEECQSTRWSEANLYRQLQCRLESSGSSPATASITLATKDGNGNPPPKDQGPSFTVSHYAGKVTYDLTGSLERNRDNLPQNILFVLKTSENVFIQQLFQCKLTQTGSLVPPAHQRLKLHGPKACLLLHRTPLPSTTCKDSKKALELSKLVKKKAGSGLLQRLDRGGPITVATQLRNSLGEITSKLQSCTPHFVQCVRPNGGGLPDSFHSNHVSNQLQYVGVLEMVRMIRYGYPVRLPFSGFLSRYRELVDTTVGIQKKLSAEDKCRQVLQHCKLQGWQMGKSKVFLRYWQADHLNDRCHQLHKKVITCQKVVRGWLIRKRVRCRVGSIGQRGGCNVQRFLQGAEELGLRTYDNLVLQNASDIARENDRQRGAPKTLTLTATTTATSSLANTTATTATTNSPSPNPATMTAPVMTGPLPLGERPEPVGKEEDSPKRPVEKCGRVHRHFRSSSVPLPLQVDHLVHSPAPSKPPLQPVSLAHSSEEGGSCCSVASMSSPRKQPPPKPKRDPNTRLSASYEAVSAGLTMAVAPAKEKDGPPSIDGIHTSPSPAGSPPKTQLSPSDLAADLSKPRPHSDDYSTMKKIPPPKPKRSPNTKLSGSYEEISAPPAPQRPTDMKLACLVRAGSSPQPQPHQTPMQQHAQAAGTMQRAASVDGPHVSTGLSLLRCQDEEDVYIEMVGASDSPEIGEAVYEEMKYFLPEDGGSVVATAPVPVLGKKTGPATSPQVMAVRPETLEPLMLQSLEAKRVPGAGSAGGEQPSLPPKQGAKDGPQGTANSGSNTCEIPAPFPNLLPHRPPLLVFPPSPVTCSPASDESPLTPLEVKKLPVFETNLNYNQEGGGGSSPLSPQYARQRADSSPSLSILLPDRSTPPLTPPPAPAPPMAASLPSALPPPPYRPPSHFPFPPEPGFLALTRGHSGSVDGSCSGSVGGGGGAHTPPLSAGIIPSGGGGGGGVVGGGKPPFSPVKGVASSRPEPRRAHSCSSSPLLFNPANGRPLTSPLDELNTLFSSGRHLLRKSTTSRKMRDGGFNSNMNNVVGREDQDQGPTSLSPQLQDKNANTHNHHHQQQQQSHSLHHSHSLHQGQHHHQHHSPSSSISGSLENGNQLSNGSLEDDGHPKSNGPSATLQHRHLDSHHTQRSHLNFSPFGAGAAL